MYQLIMATLIIEIIEVIEIEKNDFLRVPIEKAVDFFQANTRRMAQETMCEGEWRLDWLVSIGCSTNTQIKVPNAHG